MKNNLLNNIRSKSYFKGKIKKNEQKFKAKFEFGTQFRTLLLP